MCDFCFYVFRYFVSQELLPEMLQVSQDSWPHQPYHFRKCNQVSRLLLWISSTLVPCRGQSLDKR